MSFSRRIHKEMEDIMKMNLPYFVDLQMNSDNMLVWQGLLVPEVAPYDRGAFRIELSFSPQYPFKPPTLLFRTKIYHPNIAEDGKVCLPMLNSENWKPTTRIIQLIEAVVALVHSPQPENPLRPEIADEFRTNFKTFMKAAEQHTLKYAEPRPQPDL